MSCEVKYNDADKQSRMAVKGSLMIYCCNGNCCDHLSNCRNHQHLNLHHIQYLLGITRRFIHLNTLHSYIDIHKALTSVTFK